MNSHDVAARGGAVGGDRPTVLVADRHGVTRRGLRVAAEGSGFHVIAECADRRSAVRAAVQHRPDLCLLDVSLPGGGITAAREITSAVPVSRVVMLTVSHDDAELFAALEAGADGYLPKEISSDRLGDVLRGVLTGEAALSRMLAARLIGEFRRRRAREEKLRQLSDDGSLTRRELQVLELLATGQSTADVAAQLTLAPATVRSHVASAVKKLQAESREEALRRLP
jgi:two-component system NarL family response regulator